MNYTTEWYPFGLNGYFQYQLVFFVWLARKPHTQKGLAPPHQAAHICISLTTKAHFFAPGIPKHLERGTFANAFACARCDDCGLNHLVAYSGKSCGFCHYCSSRSVVERDAHRTVALICSRSVACSTPSEVNDGSVTCVPPTAQRKPSIVMAAMRNTRSLKISRSVAGIYVLLTRVAGVDWPLAQSLTDEELEARLYRPALPRNSHQMAPDFALVHQELKRAGVTLQLLWEDYAKDSELAYKDASFCVKYREWAMGLKRSMRQTHTAGEKLFVDYAGQTAPIIDASTGEITKTRIATIGHKP